MDNLNKGHMSTSRIPGMFVMQILPVFQSYISRHSTFNIFLHINLEKIACLCSWEYFLLEIQFHKINLSHILPNNKCKYKCQIDNRSNLSLFSMTISSILFVQSHFKPVSMSALKHKTFCSCLTQWDSLLSVHAKMFSSCNFKAKLGPSILSFEKLPMSQMSACLTRRLHDKIYLGIMSYIFRGEVS